MNWHNVNLSDNWEQDQNILDPYSFSTLLLEISCNLPQINEATVTAQFEQNLKMKIETAKEIFESNLKNIVKHAIKDKNER